MASVVAATATLLTSSTGSIRSQSLAPSSARSGKSLTRRQVPQVSTLRRGSLARATLDGGENQASKVVEDLKAKWDSIDDKTTVAIYGAGSLVVVWLSSTVVSAVNSVPLLPQLLELVGTLYTGWFVYRYLLFKESRKELGELVEDLKSKVTGKN